METDSAVTPDHAFCIALRRIIEDGEWVGEKKEVTNFVIEIKNPHGQRPMHDTIKRQLNEFHGDSHLDIVAGYTFPEDPNEGLGGMLSPNEDDGEYYRRLCTSRKGNQIESMIEKVDQWGRNNRTVAQVFQVDQDLNAMYPPCLLDVQVLYRDDEINLTTHFRSHTVAKSYYGDILSLARLQGWIADEVDASIGSLVVHSGSLHIRKKNDEHELAREMYDDFVA